MAINSNFRTLTADNIEGVVAPRNYLKNSFENGTTAGWTEMAVTLTSGLPTGTPTISSTAASSIALSNTTITPLSLSRSLLVTGAAGWTAGQGFISDEFTIDRMDAGKPLTVSFDYELKSGTLNFSGTLGSQTLMVYIYDATAGGANWIQPAGYLGMNQSSGPGRVTATFQSSVVAGQKYRIAVIASQAVGSACSLEFDNFVCSRVNAPIGPVVTDWVSFTPTITNLNAGTAAAQFYRWRRVGDSIQVMGNITAGGAGISIAGDVTISLPAGLSFDLNKMFISETVLGAGSIHDNGVGRFPCSVNAYTANSFALIVRANAATGANFVSNASPSASWYNASGDAISFEMMAPIQGWSSSVQMSNDTDTRVVDFKTVQATNQSIPNGTPTKVNFGSTIFDTHAGWSAGSSWYVIPVSGYYDVKSRVSFAINGTGVRYTAMYKNAGVFLAVSPILNANIVTADYVTSSMSEEFYFNAGDYIYVEAVQTSGGALAVSNGNTPTENRTALNITRRSGPSVVAVSESVNMVARNASGQSIPSASSTTITGWTKEIDSHSTFDASTGIYTIPVSGKYRVSGEATYSSAVVNSATQYSIQLQRDSGSGYSDYVILGGTFALATATNLMSINGSVSISCNAGDKLRLQTYQSSGGSRTLLAQNTWNYFTLERVGN